jgi:hypothetical protein
MVVIDVLSLSSSSGYPYLGYRQYAFIFCVIFILVCLKSRVPKERRCQMSNLSFSEAYKKMKGPGP